MSYTAEKFDDGFANDNFANDDEPYGVMPAGAYYVGDLCYVMHNEWKEVCELLFAGRDDHGCNQGVFTLKDGRSFAIFNTCYGDGIYNDNYGNEYPVDAGSIGCILTKDIEYTVDNNTTLGASVVFHTEFEVSSDGSVLKFGNIKIDTNPRFEDDEDNDPIWEEGDGNE
jgi:hypothetical protein